VGLNLRRLASFLEQLARLESFRQHEYRLIRQVGHAE
jgi:hypothetical protein